MADNLFFSRDSKVFIKKGSHIWEMPVLDGFSFSQATNTSEITLNEMTDTAGNSRRGRQMFTDSYAPAEWSFSTYARPFASTGTGAGKASDTSGQHHAVEEILWAMMVGDAAYSSAVTSAGAAASISGTSTFTALTGAAKLGTNGTFTVNTTTDGGGSGATFLLTYTESSGAIVATLGAEKGSGYTANDKIFVSKESLATALGIAEALVVTNDANNDLEATVASIASASGGTTFTGFTRDGTDLDIGFGSSNKSSLGTADIFFVLGATKATKKVYKVANCCVNEASLEFDIDGIATIAWSGMGTIITDETSVPVATITEGTGVNDTGNFIRNRLTSLSLTTAMGGNHPATYDLVLTGGSVTISNNMTFLTPETLGVVNQPLGHVTGSRSVSGSFTCYLNSEDDSSAELFENIIEDQTTITNDFTLLFKVGGTSSPRMEVNLATCHLEVPSHSIEDVISLETNFHALPSTIEGTDEITLKYVGA
jgi:hypothetical protein